MSDTVLTLKERIAAYLGRTTVDDLNPVNLTPAGPDIDLGLYALNAAARKVQRMIDLRYAEAYGALSVADVGGLFSAIAGLPAGSTVKNVINVLLPVAGGDYIPTEFLTDREWSDRLTRAVGRQPYDATKTLAQLGMANDNPIAYQQAQTIFLAPASQFTFPVAARVNVVRFMPPYAFDADHDFIMDFGAEYLLWEGILEVNKFFRRFVPKEESNISEDEVEALRDKALSSFIEWNAKLDAGTSTPPAPPQSSK